MARWADELFPLYSSTGHVLDMDGGGVDVFGIVNFSVHMIGWVMTSEGTEIWIPRRALTKMSFPGMLDNTVGGCLASGERPIDGIVRECEEEICPDPVYTRLNIKACGTDSFQLTVSDLLEPACQHQVQYLFEIELRQDIIPRIGDGEVGDLLLTTLDEVRQVMRDGKFKLTCKLTCMAFFIRHGYINAENEPDLVEIWSRLHRRHSLFFVCGREKESSYSVQCMNSTACLPFNGIDCNPLGSPCVFQHNFQFLGMSGPGSQYGSMSSSPFKLYLCVSGFSHRQ